MRTLGATLLVGLVLLFGVTRAMADSECIQQAKEERGQCRAQCDEDFVMARDICRNVDPECAAACRATLAECRAPIIAALESCTDACRDQLNNDRAACPRRGRGRDFCVDRAQIRAFLCRDECRENLQVRSGLGACRDAFQTCMAGCGISPEPTGTPPAATPTPVKTEAPEPTAHKTDSPAPTTAPTEPPHATRTATPHPEPTLTPSGPR